jgi:hypothetical protein
VFHAGDVTVVHEGTQAELIRDTDYYLTYYSRHAKANYDLDCYGGVILVNKAYSGSIKITSNHLGGGYTRYNSSVLLNTISIQVGVEPDIIYWDDLIDAPDKHYPSDHSLPAENISTGYADYVATLWLLTKETRRLADLNSDIITSVPLGAMLELLETNANISANYIPLDGSTIYRESYPELFTALAITEDSYVLPSVGVNHYVRVK